MEATQKSAFFLYHSNEIRIKKGDKRKTQRNNFIVAGVTRDFCLHGKVNGKCFGLNLVGRERQQKKIISNLSLTTTQQ